MSSTEEEIKSATNAWIGRLFPIAMSVSIAASSWFLNQAWTKISALEVKIQQIEIAAAATAGNRFTSGDWVTAKTIIDSNNAALDRRVMRLEESLPSIKESLIEIRDSLKK